MIYFISNFLFFPLVEVFQFGFELLFYLLLLMSCAFAFHHYLAWLKINSRNVLINGVHYLEFYYWRVQQQFVYWYLLAFTFRNIPAACAVTLAHSHGVQICPWWSNLDLFSLTEGVSYCSLWLWCCCLTSFSTWFVFTIIRWFRICIIHLLLIYHVQQTDIGWKNYLLCFCLFVMDDLIGGYY